MGEQAEETLPFIMDHLPNIYHKRAEIELSETPLNKVQALKELKEIMKTDSLTCGINFHDDFLVQFLRQRKYNVVNAHKRICNFLLLRRKLKDFFSNLSINSLSWKSAKKFCTILPQRCPDGCTIILYELGKWNIDEVSFEDFKRLSVALLYQALRDPMTQINGIKIIYDFTNTPIKMIKYCTPKELYVLYHGTQECFPARWKEIHLVNDSIVLKAIWSLVHCLFSEKMKKRIFFHPNRDLSTNFPRSVLPPQFGGTLEKYYMEDWVNTALEETERSTKAGECNFY